MKKKIVPKTAEDGVSVCYLFWMEYAHQLESKTKKELVVSI
jgi:hypothetical protein